MSPERSSAVEEIATSSRATPVAAHAVAASISSKTPDWLLMETSLKEQVPSGVMSRMPPLLTISLTLLAASTTAASTTTTAAAAAVAVEAHATTREAKLRPTLRLMVRLLDLSPLKRSTPLALAQGTALK